MKLIVGLGNPGKEYNNTRHNVGFMVVDKFASMKGLEFNKEKFSGVYTEYIYNGEKIIILKPMKYMNLSGEVVSSFVSYFKISILDIIVVSDDLDMPVSKIKLKENSSSGGHNGLKNIEKCLNSKAYKRLKIGISNDKFVDTKDYVLGHFSKDEKEKIDSVVNTAINVLDDFLVLDFNSLMNKYN